MVEFNAPTIIITSNIDPDNWYPYEPEASRRALRRRFTEIKKFTEPYKADEKIIVHLE